MRFQKRFNFGPVRLNLSKSGVGASVGIPGLRAGVGPRGSYTTVGLPGTGLSHTERKPANVGLYILFTVGLLFAAAVGGVVLLVVGLMVFA